MTLSKSSVFMGQITNTISKPEIKIVVAVGDNLIKLPADVMNKTFKGYSLIDATANNSLSTELNMLKESPYGVIGSLETYLEEYTISSLVLLNTGSTMNVEGVLYLELFIEFQKRNKIAISSVIELVEVVNKVKPLVSSYRTPTGEPVFTKFKVNDLKQLGIRTGTIYAARVEDIWVSDGLLENAIYNCLQILEAASEVSPVFYTSFWDVLELMTEGEMRAFSLKHSVKKIESRSNV